jgi:hypothetical protein
MHEALEVRFVEVVKGGAYHCVIVIYSIGFFCGIA